MKLKKNAERAPKQNTNPIRRPSACNRFRFFECGCLWSQFNSIPFRTHPVCNCLAFRSENCFDAAKCMRCVQNGPTIVKCLLLLIGMVCDAVRAERCRFGFHFVHDVCRAFIAGGSDLHRMQFVLNAHVSATRHIDVEVTRVGAMSMRFCVTHLKGKLIDYYPQREINWHNGTYYGLCGRRVHMGRHSISLFL